MVSGARSIIRPMATANVEPIEEFVPEKAREVRWSLIHRVVFRFVFCYFVLYCMPDTGRASLPGLSFVALPYTSVLHAIASWVAIHIFHLSGENVTYFRTGSGDTTLAYISNLLFVVFSVVVTLVWSVADRRRPNYRTLHAWLRLLVRYTLAVTLFAYGMAKVVPLQFRSPGLSKLIEPFGEFSPMGVLWNFMGASLPYTILAGSAEVLSGVLLLFRRMTTLGALFSTAVMMNVASLNYCYDVPVKLYSTNLLLMSIFLAAPDLRRLANVFVLNRTAEPADPMAVRFERRPLQIAAKVVWVAFLGLTIVGAAFGAWQGYQQFYARVKHNALYGLYDVESCRLRGRELTLATDSTRWRKVAIMDQSVVVQKLDDSMIYYPLTLQGNTLGLGGNSRLVWSRTNDDRLTLDGQVGWSAATIRIRKIDTRDLPINRGFHWIQERPFNH